MWGPLWPHTSPPSYLGVIPGWSWPARWLPQAPPRSWGGYRVSGCWPYASGSQHCTWVFGGCHVLHGDQPHLTAAGAPEVRMVLIPAAQATILEDTWEVSGLVGTGSHDFTVAQVFIPDAYTWCFGPDMPRGPHYQGPLYRFPLVGLFRLPVSAVALGIAQGALEACLALAPAKRTLIGTGVLRDQPFFQARIAEAVALVRAARAWLHTAVQQAWASTLTSGTASVAERTDLVLAAVHAMRSAAEAVQLVYTGRRRDGELSPQCAATGAARCPRDDPTHRHGPTTV